MASIDLNAYLGEGFGGADGGAGLPVLGLAGSVFFDEAHQRGLRTVPEAFADRAYQPDGQLVSRREPGTVLHDPAAIAERVVAMVIHLARCRSRQRCGIG